MTAVVVLALIAFVAPISAQQLDSYRIWDGDVSTENGFTIWTFKVTCDNDPEISNFMVAWCNQGAVEEVKVQDGGVVWKLEFQDNPGWDYGEFDNLGYRIRGIKIDYPVKRGTTIIVIIKLDIICGTANVDYGIKADNLPIIDGTLLGPDHTVPIPEFRTIAIPIASILGLLFFFNHRKRREE